MPRFESPRGRGRSSGSDRPRGRSSGRSSGRDSFTKFEDRDTSRGRGRPRGGSRDSGRSGGRDSGRGYGREERRGRSSDIEMHKVVCDECGKNCEVPYKPTSSKPIYCSDCFKKHDGKGGRSNDGGSSKVLDEINSKLDKIMKAMDLE